MEGHPNPRVKRTWKSMSPLLPKSHSSSQRTHASPFSKKCPGPHFKCKTALVLIIIFGLCMYTATIFFDLSISGFSMLNSEDDNQIHGELYVDQYEQALVKQTPLPVAPEPETKRPVPTEAVSGKDSLKLLDKLPIEMSNGYIESVGHPLFNSFLVLAELQQLYMQRFAASSPWPNVRLLRGSEQRRILVTGGAGFVGSHLIDRLLKLGHYVICLDSVVTGTRENIKQWLGHPFFELLIQDVTEPFLVEVDQIYHLATSREKKAGMNSVKMLKTLFLGTLNVLGLARRVKAKVLIVSSSDVYGQAADSPQHESYHGLVQPDSDRSSKSQGHRIAETLAYSYWNQLDQNIAVARLFDVFGPRMNLNDGQNLVARVVKGILDNKKSDLPWNSKQQVSLLYVHDAVDGLINAMEKMNFGPFNIGNPNTVAAWDLVETAKKVYSDLGIESNFNGIFNFVGIETVAIKPSISLANRNLTWRPYFKLEQSLVETLQFFKDNF